MSVTIVGVAFTADGLSRAVDVTPEGWELRRRFWKQPAYELRSHQPSKIKLNIAHNKAEPIGQVAAIHRTREGAVWVACVADAGGADRLLKYDAPIFYSPEVDMFRDGTDIELTGVALTDQPATLSIPAVTIFAGTPNERGSWMVGGKRLDGVYRDLADEATERWRHRHRDWDIHVSGHDPNSDDYPLGLREGDYVQPGQLKSRQLPNGLWKSGHAGRVLSVR